MGILCNVRMIVRRLRKVRGEGAVLIKLSVLILHTDRTGRVHAPVHKCGQQRKGPPLVDAPLRAGCTVIVDAHTGSGVTVNAVCIEPLFGRYRQPIYFPLSRVGAKYVFKLCLNCVVIG